MSKISFVEIVRASSMKVSGGILPLLLGATLLLCAPVFGDNGTRVSFSLSSVPAVDAVSVVIVDYAKGDILYELNADRIIPPASLTKLMTLHIVYEAIASGRIQKDSIVDIMPEETSPRIPYGSSLMYLQPGMKVPLLDLMKGMAIISGNDAAFTVARVLAGSNEQFAALMNQAAQELGLEKTRFVEPSGLSEFNTTTAREMADFSRKYLYLHPESLAELHAPYSMEFPRADVMPEGSVPLDRKILLRNRNDLLFSYDGCDGLKTGFIVESGYNLVATAERGGTRILLVTLGGVGGSQTRTFGASQLLDWAFANWRTVSPELPLVPAIKIWGSKARTAVPVPAEEPRFTVPASIASSIRVRVEMGPSMNAPIGAGTKAGTLVFSSGDRVLRRIDLVMPEDLPKGNIFVQLGDSIRKFFLKLFSRET